MKIENDVLISSILSIFGNFPFELTYDVKTKEFTGSCAASGKVFNVFHISAAGGECSISYDTIDYKCRNEFIRWFNSYGGKEMFLREAEKQNKAAAGLS